MGVIRILPGSVLVFELLHSVAYLYLLYHLENVCIFTSKYIRISKAKECHSLAENLRKLRDTCYLIKRCNSVIEVRRMAREKALKTMKEQAKYPNHILRRERELRGWSQQTVADVLGHQIKR
jgi:hypothetical protein